MELSQKEVKLFVSPVQLVSRAQQLELSMNAVQDFTVQLAITNVIPAMPVTTVLILLKQAK